MSRFSSPTPQTLGALRFLVSRGEMNIRRENRFVYDEISGSTAFALERRGWAERRYSTGRYGVIYATEKGAEAERLLDPPRCPHGCGPLQWCDDQWICPTCGDEWGEEVDA